MKTALWRIVFSSSFSFLNPPPLLVLVCWKFPLYFSLSLSCAVYKNRLFIWRYNLEKDYEEKRQKKVCQTEREPGKSYFAFYVSVKASFVRFIFIFLSSEPSMKIIKKENHFYLSVVVGLRYTKLYCASSNFLWIHLFLVRNLFLREVHFQFWVDCEIWAA